MARSRARSSRTRRGGSARGRSGNLGMLVLALLLIMVGFSTLIGLSFTGLGPGVAVLFVGAGLYLLMRQ